MEKVEVNTASTYPQIDGDLCWAAARRVLASQNFFKSARMSAFLTYICRCALENRSDDITEQLIGIHVFGRPTDYNPGDDNIVRTTARQLRQRLALYYQEEGIQEEIHIEVPKGGYHPNFVHLRGKKLVSELPSFAPLMATGAPESHIQPVSSVRIVGLRPVWALILTFLCGASLAFLMQRAIQRFEIHSTPVDPLWSIIFPSGRSTLFVPGDAGLNMYNNLARTQVKLGDYVSGAYLNTSEAQPSNGYTWAPLATRRYVSLADLEFSDKLRQIGTSREARYAIKFARDVHTEDLRDSNLILVGAPTYNPWVEMFDNHLNFHLLYDGQHNSMNVINRKPENGEPALYSPPGEDPSHRGYTYGFGYIALTSNLDGNGRVLIVEGSTIAGIDASISFLTNDPRMGPILKKTSRGNHRIDNFEVLLGANFIKSRSPDAEVLATRFYPTK
jgi:hypothetical protein